jgi:hypothetical protein
MALWKRLDIFILRYGGSEIPSNSRGAALEELKTILAEYAVVLGRSISLTRSAYDNADRELRRHRFKFMDNSDKGEAAVKSGPKDMQEDPAFKKDVVEAYENGKHRRYSLLFAVNGGALAIGKLAFIGSPADRIVFGGLKVWMLGGALAIFSALMTYDIWMFGKRMKEFDNSLFGPAGKTVLVLVGAMLTSIGVVVALPADFWLTLFRCWCWGELVACKLPPV